MNLINFLKKNKNVRKIFGERELKIIEKQLLGIRLTQSEKNRLSRDIRKKLDFIKEASNYTEEFELKFGAEIKKLIEETLEIIKEDEMFYAVKEVILFGSTIEKLRTFRSDIDIAIKMSEISEKKVFEFRIRVLGRVSNTVDIQIYELLPKKIKKEIDKNGKILYKKWK